MRRSTAGDLLEEALDAADEAVIRLDLERQERIVLHHSNNVVVRVGAAVLKVGTDVSRIRTEVEITRAVVQAGGPVLTPLADAMQVGRFGVSLWPFVDADHRPANDQTS